MAAACSDGNGPKTLTPAIVKIVSGDNQRQVFGSTLVNPVTLQVMTSDSTPVPNVAVNFSVADGGGSLASSTGTTNGSGQVNMPAWTMGNTEAEAHVTVTPTTGSGSTTVKAQQRLSLFDIDVQFIGSASSTQQAAFLAAANKWRTVIRTTIGSVAFNPPNGNAPAGSCGVPEFPGISGETVKDVRIYAMFVPIDGARNVLASAGPCFYRTSSGLTIVGVMRFDVADTALLNQNGQLDQVILHEMGHVLGIGSFWNTSIAVWQAKNFLTDASDTTLTDPIYNGASGKAAFATLGGTPYTGRPVPVEPWGAASYQGRSRGGTAYSHWRETVMTNELMTGYLNSGFNPMSKVTIGALADLGYDVDASKAESYNLAFTAALRMPGSPEPSPMAVVDESLPGAMLGVDNDGRVREYGYQKGRAPRSR